LAKKYSTEELQRIWNRVKPKRIEQESLRIDRIEMELKTTYSLLDALKKEMDLMKARLDKIESLERIEEEGVEELVEIPEKEALARINDYVKNHPGCRTSEIIYNLRLDPDLVLRVLKKLEEEGKVRGENTG